MDQICFQVSIYFSDFKVKTVVENEEFPTVWSFLSTLGGAVSLYLGISLIAVFELLELFIRIILGIVGMTKSFVFAS